jgi:cytochrome c553
MKGATLGLLAIAIGLAVGCANLPRSRDLANPDVSGQTLAEQVCSNCHGITGTATSPNVPNLAGQLEAYLVKQLHEFKSHSRSDPVGFEYMWGISRNLTDKQIGELAAYFAAQQPRPRAAEGKTAAIAAGEPIFTGGLPDQKIPPCASCHGPQGLGNGVFPRLAGQHADYVVKQLTVFQRTNERPEGTVMNTVAHNLTRENIGNVAAYVQTLPNEKAR